jgi:hypothetical protein
MNTRGTHRVFVDRGACFARRPGGTMKLRTLGILAALLMVLAGCGDDDDDKGDSARDGGSAGASAGKGDDAGMSSSNAGSSGASSGSGGASAGSGGSAAGSGSSGPTMSGVAGSTRVDALTDDDKQKLCDWGAHLPGLGVEKQCPDDSVVVASVDTGQDCIDALDVTDCSVTVSQYEACIEAQLAEPCEFFFAACDALFSCGP